MRDHQRKHLAAAFSDRSLREQEVLIAELVDAMLGKLDDIASSTGLESGAGAVVDL
jgi:hypothetical protein